VLDVFVDADGCPVKEEVYRVVRRCGLKAWVVSNKRLRVPDDDRIEGVVVDGGFDAADDWIAGRIGAGDIAVTADIPLAARCLERGARVLDPKGREFTADSIGDALATRELMSTLREMGTVTGGPAPFEPRDRSRFLARLDEVIQSVIRKPPR
jgi:uncharacterized protein YaiI (UPF0178 family)